MAVGNLATPGKVRILQFQGRWVSYGERFPPSTVLPALRPKDSKQPHGLGFRV